VALHEGVGHALRGLAGGKYVDAFVRGNRVRDECAAEEKTGVTRPKRGVEDEAEVGTNVQ
jgi:hypothetical protein